MSESAAAIEAALLDLIEERTEPDPDGVPNAYGNLWTGLKRLRQEASKGTVPCTRDDVERHVHALADRGEVLNWFGCLAPATDEHLVAIVENERMATIPRRILIAKVNEIRGSGEVAG